MTKLHAYFLFFLLGTLTLSAQTIPLPEHPRPDWERSLWQNLNGIWEFEFDSLNTGMANHWQAGTQKFTKKITVPFPWGSKLSGVKDEADIAWYKREINVPLSWKNKRTFFTIGASDWETSVWLDGHFLGKYQGGYTPFSVDLTDYLQYGQSQTLVVRVDDARRMFTLYGKQGYGNASGIWQTAYLEARGKNFIEYAHFKPDIDKGTVTVEGEMSEAVTEDQTIKLELNNGQMVNGQVKKGQQKFQFSFALNNPKLWSLENPHLYELTLSAADDVVKSYFGYRKISVTNLPGTEIPYIALNNKPVYLQLTLDQSYHPDGFYTFPSDEFMKNEIVLAKNIGLNGIRTHIKVEIPRKLYWADKLGCLVMADLPNSWGEPDFDMQQAAEFTLREMIRRDFNHPAIFSWIVFNETWGLRTKVERVGKSQSVYLPETQLWVASMYYLTKSLDQTRLVEDNSICCGAGHTETDIYSWHQYLPGYKWEEFMQNLDKTTFEGSTYDFEPGFKQGRQPMINSECGNVWGYDGSTGDVDWSYDYHRMMNSFRMHPKMAGWLYTEHHDVINEWNGYWKFDRSPKYTGLDELVPGMKDTDLHSLIYLSNGQDITLSSKAGVDVAVPMFLSSMTAEPVAGNKLMIYYGLKGTTETGEAVVKDLGKVDLNYSPWMQKKLDDLRVKAPETNGLYTLWFEVKDEAGKVLHRNFVHLEVTGGQQSAATTILSVAPDAFSSANWSLQQWKALDGLKMNGAGNGYFEYEFKGDVGKAKSGYLLVEVGAKQLFAKDKTTEQLKDMDYMLGAVADPAQNKNAYPMTDSYTAPSDLVVEINGQRAYSTTLKDDPADHRGVLSWFHQKENNKLDEAGSYGYMIKVPLSKSQLSALKKNGSLNVNLISNDNGGLAVYGKKFGRDAFDPSIVLK